MAGRYSTTLRIIRSGYVLLRGEEMRNSIKIISIIILFLLGMGFCLYFPYLLHSVTGINIYIYNSTDPAYSLIFLEIRKMCANVFLFLLIYFCIFILCNMKLHLSILNKSMLGASCIIVKGGFEGLGDPELDTQHVSTNPMRGFNSSKFQEKDEELLSLALFKDKNESLSTNSSSTTPQLNPDVKGVPIPYPPGYKTAGSSTSSLPDFPDFGSVNWYNPSSTSSTTTSEVTKKVSFNNNEEVTEIPNISSLKKE